MYRVMPKSIVKSALLALFLMVAAFLSVLTAAEPPVHFDTEQIFVESAGGKRHFFTVELAITPEQRERGLMYRKMMADDRGMLFDFGEPRQVMMWMKNTELPLDMLFADEDGRITRIAERAVPFSETIVDSRGAVKFVLELNAGMASELGIRPGDRLVSRRILGGD